MEGMTRRRALHLGATALAGGVGAAALAACGEAEVRTVEVPVERIVTVTEIKEVEVEKIVKQEVIKEVAVQKVVTVEKVKVVEVERSAQPEGVVEIGPVKAVRAGHYRDTTPWNPRFGGTIRYGSPANINNLDPLHFPDFWSLMAGGQPLYEQLVGYGPGPTIQPWLAEDWDESKDLLSYTFRLRNDVKFHDGEPFNAEAVKYNCDLWSDPANNPGAMSNIGNQLTSVDIIDDFTVRMNLKEVNVFFLAEIAGGYSAFTSPLAHKTYGEDLTRNPVGTGPFKFKQWKENLSLHLTRFDDYAWGPPWATNKGPSYANDFVAYEMPDVSAKVAAYEAGDVHFMQHYSLTELQPLFGDPAHQLFINLVPGQPWYLQTNTKPFPTDDVAVRRALIHATDRNTVVRSVTLGFGALAGSLLVPGTVGYNPDLDGMYEHDIGKANQLLDDAGYARGSDGFRYSASGEALEISFPDTPNPFSQPYKLNIENAIGIRVATPNMEWGTAVEQYLQGLHTHKWQGGTGLEGGLTLYTVYHSRNFGVPGNRAFTWYYDEEIDTLLDGIRSEPDQSKRHTMTDRVHTLVMEQALGVPLTQWGSLFAHNTRKVGGRMMHTILNTPYLYDLYSTEE